MDCLLPSGSLQERVRLGKRPAHRRDGRGEERALFSDANVPGVEDSRGGFSL